MWVALIWIPAVIVGGIIGSRKGKGGLGFVLGLLLSWLGVIIIAVVQPNHDKLVENGIEQKCPHCAEYISSEAKVCKHCGKDVAPESA
jgi:uncharacterized protein (DUF983 family)